MKKNVLIVGVSGAGKSTLVNAIAGQTVAKVTKGDAVTQEITTYKNIMAQLSRQKFNIFIMN